MMPTAIGVLGANPTALRKSSTSAQVSRTSPGCIGIRSRIAFLPSAASARRNITGKEPQARDGEIEQVGIGVRHQFVGLLGRTIKAERVIDILPHAERQFGVGAVNRGG